jgi:hypothetical protein
MADSADAGFLQLNTPQSTTCSLHPVVMFEVLDHYTRRNIEDGRYIPAVRPVPHL